MLFLNVFIAAFVFLFRTTVDAKVAVCFYTNWAQYRNGAAKFVPENIDPSLCTHVNYAFAQIDYTTHEVKPYEWNDDQMIPRVLALKQSNPKLKVLISIGGWNHELEPRYSRMVTNSSTRKIFIDSAIAFLKQYSFDGLSLDWEYPANRGSPPEDKQKYTLLLKEIRAAFTAQSLTYTFSASVAAGRPVIETAYEIESLAEYLDWVNLMSYDLHGSWENVTGHSTAMTGPTPNVPDSLQAWLEGGMPPSKLVLGLASYGRSFTLKHTNETGLGVPVNGAGLAGKYTRASGFLSYYEVCDTQWTSVTTWTASAASAPYASKTNQWIGYESSESIRHKVTTLVNGHNLLGISLWALDLDDFTGEFCKLGKYPLLKTAVDAMNSEEHIQFHPSNTKQTCVATQRWRHIQSLTKWCKERCLTEKNCPPWMCECYSV